MSRERSRNRWKMSKSIQEKRGIVKIDLSKSKRYRVPNLDEIFRGWKEEAEKSFLISQKTWAEMIKWLFAKLQSFFLFRQSFFPLCKKLLCFFPRENKRSAIAKWDSREKGEKKSDFVLRVRFSEGGKRFSSLRIFFLSWKFGEWAPI